MGSNDGWVENGGIPQWLKEGGLINLQTMSQKLNFMELGIVHTLAS